MALERSLAVNAALASRYEKLVALRAAMRANAGDQRAPEALRARIAAMASDERTGTLAMPIPALGFARRPRVALAAALAMAFVGGGLVTTLIRDAAPGRSDRVALLLVDDHRRALLAREAIDIASSDRHTVKPWFDARLAVSPPVVDLAAQGFALVGGRADVVEGLPAPTLVYRLREHLISLTALPAERFRARAPQAAVNGYETIAWSTAPSRTGRFPICRAPILKALSRRSAPAHGSMKADVRSGKFRRVITFPASCPRLSRP